MKTVKSIVKYLEGRGFDASNLDDVVHDCKGEEAASINNGGMESQVEYLLSCGLEPDNMVVEDFSAAD